MHTNLSAPPSTTAPSPRCGLSACNSSVGKAYKSAPDRSCRCLRSVVRVKLDQAAGNVIPGGLVADEETLRDLFVRQSAGHKFEHFEFALAQFLSSDCFKESLRDVRRNAALVLVHHLNCLNDLLLGSALEKVPHRTGLQRAKDVLIFLVIRQHENPDIRVDTSQLRNRVCAFH